MATEAKTAQREKILRDLGLDGNDPLSLEARDSFITKINNLVRNFPRNPRGATSREKLINVCEDFLYSGVGRQYFGAGRLRMGKGVLWFPKDVEEISKLILKFIITLNQGPTNGSNGRLAQGNEHGSPNTVHEEVQATTQPTAHTRTTSSDPTNREMVMRDGPAVPAVVAVAAPIVPNLPAQLFDDLEVGVADPVYVQCRFYDFTTNRSTRWTPNTSMERIRFEDVTRIIHRPRQTIHSLLFWLENGHDFCRIRTISPLNEDSPAVFDMLMRYFLSQIRQGSDRRQLGYVSGAPLWLKIGVVSNQ